MRWLYAKSSSFHQKIQEMHFNLSNQGSEKKNTVSINSCKFKRIQQPVQNNNNSALVIENSLRKPKKYSLPFKYPLISGIPDPAAAGAKLVIINAEEKTKTKLINIYRRNPVTYDF